MSHTHSPCITGSTLVKNKDKTLRNKLSRTTGFNIIQEEPTGSDGTRVADVSKSRKKS
jgi:hypothetical protein